MFELGNYRIGQLNIGNVVFQGVTTGVYGNLPESFDKRSVRAGVYGNAFDNYNPKEIGMDIDKIGYKSHLIGEEIAREGLIFVNGACPGFPNIAAQGAREKKGVVTGFSPVQDENTHFRTYGLGKDTIPHLLITYLGKPICRNHRHLKTEKLFVTRDVVSVFSSDAVFVIGGSYGTNHEVAIAAELGLPIGLIKNSGGVADLAKRYYESIIKPNNSAVFIEEENPKLLVEMVLQELQRRGTRTREFMPCQDPLDTVLQMIEIQQKH